METATHTFQTVRSDAPSQVCFSRLEQLNSTSTFPKFPGIKAQMYED